MSEENKVIVRRLFEEGKFWGICDWVSNIVNNFSLNHTTFSVMKRNQASPNPKLLPAGLPNPTAGLDLAIQCNLYKQLFPNQSRERGFTPELTDEEALTLSIV